MKLLIRDFDAGLEERNVRGTAGAVVASQPSASVEIRIAESYRNMREILEGPEVVECGREAPAQRLTPVERPIRSGTDGSRLSFMGCPRPTSFAGEHNFHSRLEWVSAQTWTRRSRRSSISVASGKSGLTAVDWRVPLGLSIDDC